MLNWFVIIILFVKAGCDREGAICDRGRVFI